MRSSEKQREAVRSSDVHLIVILSPARNSLEGLIGGFRMACSIPNNSQLFLASENIGYKLQPNLTSYSQANQSSWGCIQSEKSKKKLTWFPPFDTVDVHVTLIVTTVQGTEGARVGHQAMGTHHHTRDVLRIIRN